MVVFPCLVTTYIEIGDEADGDVKVVMWSSKWYKITDLWGGISNSKTQKK